MKHLDLRRAGYCRALSSLALLVIAGTAQAQTAPATTASALATDVPAIPSALVSQPGSAMPAAALKPSPFGAGAAVGLQRLNGSRGGASTSTQVDIGGVVKDASATNVSTGNNAIRDGSFSNAVGFNTVIQNSGANVLIQNSMTVNVQFK